MEEYKRQREAKRRTAVVTGLVVTVALHAGGIALMASGGLTYMYPGPEELSYVIDYTQIEAEVIPPARASRQPRSETPDKTKPVELAQRSQSPFQSDKPNTTPATKPDPVGDVDVPTPPVKEEPKLIAQASFPGMSQKDTSKSTTPHSAQKASDSFKAGQPDGNTKKGNPDGRPNAHLEGRNVEGGLVAPQYKIQDGGIVVIKIFVDQMGNVVQAYNDAGKSTIDNATLVNAARKAALETHFSKDTKAQAIQEGHITYYFNLK